ncbi:NAD(P)H-binding protein [Plantactinospora sp. S1510]|uniref:NAD(P)H-binding protein n=1 Tax=Plantactinospora alkalitolerans TaxID=2789879 RepID=A0ABS0H610_9ACTN|nr:NAD(P)H-binding protein [Plantactinospora alkalitolerans]MBF9133911.1 NAD(P)H-binding protein [Plantactinospora alkalitolerans]
MILVTGATGTIGSSVLRLLRDQGGPVRAMSRTPAKITAAAQASGSVSALGSGSVSALGSGSVSASAAAAPTEVEGEGEVEGEVEGEGEVEVVRGDFDDPVSLRRAVAGVEAVFLLTAPVSPTPRHDLALVEAARAAGVARIVKLSAIGTGERFGADQVVGDWHLEAEQAVRAGGLAWTLLRPSSFASNTLGWAGAIAAGTPVPNLTGAGRQGVVDPRDVAEVAVAALTSDGHVGRTYTLTGPAAISVPEQAEVLADLLGRPIGTIDLIEEAARQRLTAAGLEPTAVRAALIGSAWARAGRNETVTDDVPRILGRPAATFRTWARDHRTAFGVVAGG